MAIPADISAKDAKDVHEHDLVMPGFRFHPTEEELIEFYLRRKVEGKRFNVEVITFVDLYSYDPWQLPALAVIGDKEWYFYVPRDRKYRNGDRPNRVTVSGYWKATGADRMVKAENNRPIGLKKTLVFYSGKAPKGLRTSWIMNEYRLPQYDTNGCHKTEISLCRVYKRAGVEENGYHQQPGVMNSNKTSTNSSTDKRSQNNSHKCPETIQTIVGDSSTQQTKAKQLRGEKPRNIGRSFPALHYGPSTSVASMNSTTTSNDEDSTSTLHHSTTTNFLNSSTPTIDELNSLAGLNESTYVCQYSQLLQTPLRPQLLHFSTTPMPYSTPISDKLWEWNSLSEIGKE